MSGICGFDGRYLAEVIRKLYEAGNVRSCHDHRKQARLIMSTRGMPAGDREP